MPREQRHAVIICIILSIIAGLGIFLGIYLKWALIVAIAMIPAVIYEVYRTEGFFTKVVSFLCLLIVLAEIFVIVTHSTVDLSKISGNFLKSIPFLHENIQAAFIGPILLVILCLFLFKRTAGIYTQWLSIIILVSSIALFYTSNPEFFSGIINSGNVQETIKKEIKNKIPD